MRIFCTLRMRDQEERQTHGDPVSDSGEGAEVPVIWTSLLAWSDPVRCSARRPRGDFPLPAGVLHLRRHILRSRELRQAQDKAGMGSLTRAETSRDRHMSSSWNLEASCLAPSAEGWGRGWERTAALPCPLSGSHIWIKKQPRLSSSKIF